MQGSDASRKQGQGAAVALGGLVLGAYGLRKIAQGHLESRAADGVVVAHANKAIAAYERGDTAGFAAAAAARDAAEMVANSAGKGTRAFGAGLMGAGALALLGGLGYIIKTGADAAGPAH